MGGENRRTREERRRARYAAICRVITVLGVVLALLLFLGMMGAEEAPLPGERVGKDVATFYAAEEYDRLMECWGDPGAAQRGAEQVYWEVISKW